MSIIVAEDRFINVETDCLFLLCNHILAD